MSRSLVVIGNGMAPGRMLEHLLEDPNNDFDITIFNAEPRVNYNRLMLSPVLSGEKTYADIITHNDQWYAEHNITLHKSDPIQSIDYDNREVISYRGVRLNYDKLVVATGSQPNRLPVPGISLDGVMTYRDLDDVEIMLGRAGQGGKAVVIGGGLLGLEAAAGLHEQGIHVTVLHFAETLMEKQLDTSAGHLLESAFSDRGIKIITQANTTEILGENNKVCGVTLADGTQLPADLVVMAVGIRPSTDLAETSGLSVNHGIVVNDQMQTSNPDIFALGECVEHREVCYGLVAPLYDMARVLANNLTGSRDSYTGSVTSTKLKVNGIDLYSAGDFSDHPDRENIVLRDASAGIYKRIVIENNHIVGVVLFGDTADGPWLFELLKSDKDISEQRDTLIFGPAYADGGEPDPTAAVAALPDNAEICGCNGICKGAITQSINSLKLTTLDDVRMHTKASSSCGTCTGLVEQLLTLELGSSYQASKVTSVCGCTSYGHNDVRRLIVSKSLMTIPGVMQALEWNSPGGCAKCRPALNYYLICAWPAVYADDYRSRFINERAHANIQKDGTYSVVPRMWGGMTTANELRAIADVVDKFKIPSVKVTGGQRIDMLGVKNEDLPLVWKDLGDAGFFVSGHAYAKGLRTVKTCVGKTWCRFGTQDSTGLAILLEKSLWGSWTPAKVKLAVSGCPRNCAEATCKDVGVICVDSSFEIHFAGAAGLDIIGTEVLGHVQTVDEVLEHVAALVQMYREQGHYLERIYKWAKRIGVEEIREQIMNNAEKREHYLNQFKLSQQFAQVDPWKERAEGYENQEFTTMKPQIETAHA